MILIRYSTIPRTLACVLCLGPAAAIPAGYAQTPLAETMTSSDIHARIPASGGGQVVGDDDDIFRIDARTGTGEVLQAWTVGNAYDVDALTFSGPVAAFSIDTVASIDSTLIRPADVFEFLNGCASPLAGPEPKGLACGPRVIFDGRANSIPDGVNADAIAVDSDNGDLLLSFDRTFTLPGPLQARPAAVFRFDGSDFTVEFDGSLVPNAANLDAVHLLDNGHMLMSFDIDVALPGDSGTITAADDDVVEFDPASATFSVAFRPREVHSSWFAADTDALWANPLGDSIFSDRFEE